MRASALVGAECDRCGFILSPSAWSTQKPRIKRTKGIILLSVHKPVRGIILIRDPPFLCYLLQRKYAAAGFTVSSISHIFCRDKVVKAVTSVIRAEKRRKRWGKWITLHMKYYFLAVDYLCLAVWSLCPDNWPTCSTVIKGETCLACSLQPADIHKLITWAMSVVTELR